MSSLAVKETQCYNGGRLLQSELISDCVDEQVVRDEFTKLSERWKRETEHLSSLNSICRHEAYEGIIALGEPALALILQDLKEGPQHWFWALKKITGADPVAAEIRGNLPAMRAAWLQWADQQGIDF